MLSKSHFVLYLFLAMMACAPQPSGDDLLGRWKFISGSEKKRPVFPSIEFIKAATGKGYLLYFDKNQTGFINEKAVLVNPSPYDVRNDTLITHTRGLDIVQRFRFDTRDTLWLYDKDSIVMKFSRIK
jgi:hypothetical protein